MGARARARGRAVGGKRHGSSRDATHPACSAEAHPFFPFPPTQQRAALGLHGAAIVKELWCHFTRPGTFHRVFAALSTFLRHPTHGLHLPPLPSPLDDASGGVGAATGAGRDWYVTEADLAVFRDACENPASDASWGDPLFSRDYGALTYTAWRRFLPDGKTEYKSVTLALDATAAEFTDFYLDDRARTGWDTMIADHASLEIGDPATRCQVVRWRRSFPFAFLSDREYIIARRVWAGAEVGVSNDDGADCLYTATKTIPHHPAAPPARGVVAMDTFYSMWRCRTVADPGGGPAPACEVVLLHREDFKIPERLARVAVRAGMAGFVRGMAPAVRAFVDARRRRVPAHSADPSAYGVGCAAAAAAAAAHASSPPPRLTPTGRPLPPARSCPQLSGGARCGGVAKPAHRRVRVAEPPTGVDTPHGGHHGHHARPHHRPHHRAPDGKLRGRSVAVAALAVALAAVVVGGAVAARGNNAARQPPARKRREVEAPVEEAPVEEAPRRVAVDA